MIMCNLKPHLFTWHSRPFQSAGGNTFPLLLGVYFNLFIFGFSDSRSLKLEINKLVYEEPSQLLQNL